MRNLVFLLRIFLALFLLASFSVAEEAAAESAEPAIPEGDFSGAARLILPPVIHALTGLETNVYFDAAFLLLNPADVAVDVISQKGRHQAERWTWTPPEDAVGDFPFKIELRDGFNAVVARASSKIHVTARQPVLSDKPVHVLMIGASMTQASVYPARVLELSKEDGFPLQLIGTRGRGKELGEVRHEGYGGWTARRFATSYVDPKSYDKNDPDAKPGSPFLFKNNPDDEAEEAKLDLRRYCDENNGGVLPDFVTFIIGCNDVFRASDETIEEEAGESIRYHEVLVAMIRRAAPEAWIGFLMLPPPAASQDAFGKDYGSRYLRWQYLRNRQRLNELFLETFGNRVAERMEVLGDYLNIDPVHGYEAVEVPASLHSEEEVSRLNSGVHPNAAGYNQIGDGVYAWIRGRM